MPYELISVTLRNLHGFGEQPTTLDLSRERMVLVGPNNSGKTAVLKILDWLLNEADEDVLRKERGRILTEDECAILIPARDTKKQARRLTLRVRVPRNKARVEFEADADGVVMMRYDLKTNPFRGELHLGAPVRRKTNRNPKSNQLALELRSRLRDDLLFLHIPSFRDARSERFRETVRAVYRARLEERALHKKQGKTVEARHLDDALANLDEVTSRLVQPLWDELRPELPPGLAREGRFAFGGSRPDLLEWLIDQLAFRVSTDEHDAHRVNIEEVGAGLQSLLDLAVNLAEARQAGRAVLLAVEEPEAFLHPSAQRTLARHLLTARPNTRLVVTTHSPLVVDEADAADVVLVKRHRFYAPTILPGREEIHSTYMRGQGAEAMFSSGVLLVEGQSDALFFEALRRRAAAEEQSGHLDQLRVVWTGSNTQFGPWIQLFNAYGQGEDRPVQWLAVFDADAGKEAREGLNAAGITVPQEVGSAISSMNAAKTATTKVVVDPTDVATLQAHAQAAADWRQLTREVNTSAQQHSFPIQFLPVDLEDAILENASTETCEAVWSKMGKAPAGKDELLYHLGSKAQRQKGEPEKAPWVRGFVGDTIPMNELGSDVRDILKAWFAFVMRPRDADRFVGLLCALPPPPARYVRKAMG